MSKAIVKSTPTSYCSAGSSGILNRRSKSSAKERMRASECGPLTEIEEKKTEPKRVLCRLNKGRTKNVGEIRQKKNRIHISVTSIMCHYFHFPFFRPFSYSNRSIFLYFFAAHLSVRQAIVKVLRPRLWPSVRFVNSM